MPWSPKSIVMTQELDFDNLPLIEASVRASFNAAKSLTFSLLNSTASELKSEFPILSEAKQLEAAPGATGIQFEFGPGVIAGAEYSGNKDGVTVSVQPQVIVARWAKLPGLTTLLYPRYDVLQGCLWRAVEAFRKASGDEFPGIAVVNMSYVNFIRASDPAAVLRTYFSDLAQLGALRTVRQVRKLEAAWNEDDDLDVRFSIEQAVAKLPDGATNGYCLTTAAGLRLAESLDAKSGLAKVHDRLQTFFLQLISGEAKKEWELRGAPNG